MSAKATILKALTGVEAPARESSPGPGNPHLALALRLAARGVGKFRLGAVLARRSRVVSVGWNNMRKSHPLMAPKLDELGWFCGLHAEVDACLGVPKGDLAGCEIWVARILRDGSAALARPCGFCQRFLRGVGVRRAWFTVGGSEAAGVGSLDLLGG